MAEGEEVWYSIYEARDENMVSKDEIHTVRIARFLKPLVQSVNQGSSHSIVVWNFLREQAEMAIRCSVERLEHAPPETMGRMLGLSSQKSRFHLEPKWYM
jgi:hypothetical protein